MPRELIDALRLDEAELRSRRALFEITDEDLQRLVKLRPIAEANMNAIVDAFYELLLSHPGTRRFIVDDAALKKLKTTQRAYFMQLFEGRCDLAYAIDRLRVGAAHERIGMATQYYVAAYRRYLALVLPVFEANIADRNEAMHAYRSLQRLVMFDMSIALDAYAVANVATISRHQQAIRELSTPVIRVHDRVLLLPLIGAIDTHRAEQVMESVLERIVAESAKVIIIDIAGVPVVDTSVADHLMKTSAAAGIIGAKTILTGITANVAKTIVQLGIDISTMHTRSRLADGLALGLSFVGQSIERNASNA